ncbi:heparinase II/III-family protein [Vibrio aestuarianus]|nr:heparinase II/III-family protein [Vibrio aestuarianus]
MLLLKHSPYGGEHDHYDRLGLILIKDGKEILPDVGTTGYGAELHYGYYKNSASHNTLVVNQKNQTPANPEVLNYIEQDDYQYIDTCVDWRKPAATVDSHTIKQWDEESYRDIQFRRSILWFGDLAIEINQVKNPHQQNLDLTWHTRGTFNGLPCSLSTAANPLSGPLARMHSCKRADVNDAITRVNYRIPGCATYTQHHHIDGGHSILTGLAPDNPATSDLSYLLIRGNQQQLRCVTLHDLNDHYQLLNCEWKLQVLTIVFRKAKERFTVNIDFKNSSVKLEQS